MKSFLLLIVFELLFCMNKDPVFLIHGFLGWGREEMGEYRYWGGKVDYQNELRRLGFEVFTLSVGPLSSNWDRAVEAYTQIKGGCVDYGVKHSKKFGIIQKPVNKCFEGIYPQWSEEHPIHLVGHSQGGTTIRMLEYLLVNEFKDESSLLLKNKYEKLIKSITTISTPHDGTTLAPKILDIFPFAQSLSRWIAPFSNIFLKNIYQFDLEQWGISPSNEKTSKAFWNNIGKSKIRDSKNFSVWDLSLVGSKEFNSKYITNNYTYYFSFSNYSTQKEKNSPLHIPDAKTRIMFRPAAKLIGKSNKKNHLWNKNDSIVNTISMKSPTSGDNGPEPSMQYSGQPIIGVWQYFNELNESHHSIIGVHSSKKQSRKMLEVYIKHLELLYTL